MDEIKVSGLSDFQKNAIILALRRMYKGSHFDICTVDEILKLTGKHMNPDDHKALHLLHCVHWEDMGKDMMKQSFHIILEALDATDFEYDIMDRELKKTLGKDSFIKRMLN